MPFIAPAFVLLKVIIDIEKRAQDTDAKCNDLVERITFMLGHVPALRGIEIKSSTRQVIERVNDALKDAAALIAAYRKQGRVARRLSFSNQEKFSACAENINDCCRDLLMSLQIHQSLQLDILTREIPVDDEDKAAKRFVKKHGGDVVAVVNDRELVKEFASQRDFVMDDTVMEQLHTDIDDAVKQNHSKLEKLLRDNVSAAIAGGFKDLALEINAMDAEQKFKCVQCDKEFTDHSNGPKACSFHRAEYDSYSKNFPCCTTSHPCQFGTHRIKHHCDYPYGSFFPHTRELSRYVNTRDEWAAVGEVNLETDASQTASVSQLLRWFSRGPRVEENILVIIIGQISYKGRYYLNTFTSKELQDLSKSLHISGRTMICRTSDDENEYTMAEWILSASGKIVGVRLTAKCATSAHPCIRVCLIDIETCTKSGDVLTISAGGFPSYTPSSPYVLPENVFFGPTLTDAQSRPVRIDFKSKSTLALPLILKTTSNPPLTPSTTFSTLSGKITVYNNSHPDSMNSIAITSVEAFYRMVGDPDYLPVNVCTVVGGLEAPVNIEPRKSWLLDFRVSIPQVKRKTNLDSKWWDREFLCRHRPIRIKIVVKDIMDEESSLVLEHVFKPTAFPQRADGDVGFFFLDDPQDYCRYGVNVKYGTEEKSFVQISSYDIDIKALQKAVYKALKTGKTEVELLNIQGIPKTWEWSAWALVDVSCRRVYAIKVLLKESKQVLNPRMGCVGYILCPSYGKVLDEKREISYAKEVIRLPPMEPFTFPKYPQDDDYDDDRPPQSQEPTSTKADWATNGVAKAENVLALQTRLASIDTNLIRIAATLDKLVTMMTFLFIVIFIRIFF